MNYFGLSFNILITKIPYILQLYVYLNCNVQYNWLIEKFV